MLEIQIYPKAESDLEEIWTYTYNTWGSAQAEHYIDEFALSFAFLAENPLICYERNEYVPAVRIYHHAHHLILYTTTDSTLQIIRILHKNMDVDVVLEEEEN